MLLETEKKIIARYLALSKIEYEVEYNNKWLNDRLSELNNAHIRPVELLNNLVDRHIIRWCCESHRWIFNY